MAVGLDPGTFGPRSPFTLSGGEARRAAIAGALAMGAPYLLLDEPTAGLDARGRRDVLAAIEAERATAGVVVVTHDPDEFLGLGDPRARAGGSAHPSFDGTVRDLTDDPCDYEAAGLRLPDVVRTQVLARERGAHIAPRRVRAARRPHGAAARRLEGGPMRVPVTFGQYVPTDSPMHALDAKTKMGLVAAFTAAMFLVDGFAGLAALARIHRRGPCGSRGCPARIALRGIKALTLAAELHAASSTPLRWNPGDRGARAARPAGDRRPGADARASSSCCG